jgi:hypothetical protein
VALDTLLSWTAGGNATSHRVYFGANSNAVMNATTNMPEFQGSLTGTTYGPGTLASSGRFYWRVDELVGTDNTPGSVWTFATMVDANATFALAGALGGSDSIVSTFPSLVGQTYRVQRSDSLSPAFWSTVADGVAGTGDAISIADPGVSLQRQRFYRVLLLAP